VKTAWLAGLVAVALALAAVCCDVNVQLGVIPGPDAAAVTDAADAAD
jgi:hypothetical protein